MPKKIILVDDSKTILATAEMALEGLITDGTIILKSYLNTAEIRDALLSGAEDLYLLVRDVTMRK